MIARSLSRPLVWAPLLLGSLAWPWTSTAAPGTFAFKAQVLHDRLGPMKRFMLTVDGQPAITDDGGVLQVPLASDTTHVVVAVSGGLYAIHYPYGGFVSVPRDLKDLPQIVIGSPQSSDYLRQYVSLYQVAKRGAARQAGELAALDEKVAALRDLLLRLHYSDGDLRAAKEMQDRKDEYFPEVTADVIDFKTRAADLKTAFKYTSELAFENSNALQRLQEAVTNYNTSFNKLQRQRPTYQKRIAELWQNDVLTAHFRQLMAMALDQIHVGKIYPMQPIIADINRYFVGKARDADRKKRIQNEVAMRVKDLEACLPSLEALSAKVLAELGE